MDLTSFHLFWDPILIEEAVLRKWYNLETTTAFEAGEANLSSEVMLQSESSDDDVMLLQTDSENDDDDDGLLLASGSEFSGGEQHLETETETETVEPPAKKRKYNKRSSEKMTLKFLGQAVCRAAHMRLYGIGSNALQNVRDGRQAFAMYDNRLEEPKHATLGVSLTRSNVNTKWPSILSFFWMLYISVAEIMPTKFVMPSNGAFSESFMEKDPDFQERYTRSFMNSLERNLDLSSVTCLCTTEKSIINVFVF